MTSSVAEGPGEPPIRVILVDDHPLVLAGMARLVEADPAMAMAGTATTAKAAVELFDAVSPDVTILDVNLQGESGFSLARILLARRPGAKILVLSGHHEVQYQRTAFQIGAHGYLQKTCTSAELSAALVAVRDGRLVFGSEIHSRNGRVPDVPPLTRRELEVLSHIRTGLSNRDIARRLVVSERTVHFHVGNLLSKLQSSSRTQAVARGRELGWLSD
ncbi:response regulator transcription factor [Sinomonas sp. JGH33]|uniref:Response regulator transcription factor n=1 Tax=Sinomonas terricola TaxID=3110330 RepID=A0ABU5T2A0_9MICC|nr:response regulator transcription factor [Sinomonas sp. JGH33]MEA5453695.1 response regulator transcription factor [Sinomonas sp. JGH33]